MHCGLLFPSLSLHLHPILKPSWGLGNLRNRREYGKKVVAVRVCLYHMWTPSLLKALMDPTSCNTMQLFEWVFPPEEQDFPVLFSLSLLMVCSACWSWKEWVTILGPFGIEAAVVYINRLANLNSQLFAVSLEVWALSGNLTSFSSCSYAERWWKWHDGMWLSELRICTPFGDLKKKLNSFVYMLFRNALQKRATTCKSDLMMHLS